MTDNTSTAAEAAKVSKAQQRASELRTHIAGVAAGITEPETATLAKILTRAATGQYGGEAYSLTPAICAKLFLEHNPHNRDWDPNWTLELSRRMTSKMWLRNNELPGFYVDGALEDSQHRLAAAAHAGMTWTTVVMFGIDREAIITVDCGRKRDAASALKMDGVQEAKLKQTIAKNSAAYLVKHGDERAALRSEMEIAQLVHRDANALNLAINIAELSEQNLITPVLRMSISATIAYLMLTAIPAWSEFRVREKLALFQTGQSEGGESEPFFIAGKIIEASHDAKKTGKRLSTSVEIGMVLHAMRLSEQGVRAVNQRSMRAAVDNKLPDPSYPQPHAMAAE